MQDRLSSSCLSASRATQVADRLGARDRDVMRLVARFRLMSGAQLSRLLWSEGRPASSARLARRSLARLADLDVLERLPRRVGGVRAGSEGLVFALGRVGQRLVLREPGSRRVRRTHAPGARYVAHTLAVTELYVRLVEAQRWDAVELLAFDPEPACWRPYPGPFGARLLAKPDAHLRVAMGEYELSWFIEMDLATEAPVTLARKAGVYRELFQSGSEQRAHGVFPRVAWLAPDERRAALIRATLARTKVPPELFAVATAAEAVSLLSTGGTS